MKRGNVCSIRGVVHDIRGDVPIDAADVTVRPDQGVGYRSSLSKHARLVWNKSRWEHDEVVTRIERVRDAESQLWPDFEFPAANETRVHKCFRRVPTKALEDSLRSSWRSVYSPLKRWIRFGRVLIS